MGRIYTTQKLTRKRQKCIYFLEPLAVIISPKYLFQRDQSGVLNLQGRLSNQQSDCVFYFSRLVSIESYHISHWAVIASRN